MEDFGYQSYDEPSWFIFDDDFNQELNPRILEILKNYTHIKFGSKFNKSIDNLPDNIVHLKIGEDFKGNNGDRPMFLRKTGWVTYFNQKINKYPASVKNLELGYSFNQNLDNLPLTIEVLELGHEFTQPLDFLPTSLKTLMIRNKRYPHNLLNLPPNVKLIIPEELKIETNGQVEYLDKKFY